MGHTQGFWRPCRIAVASAALLLALAAATTPLALAQAPAGEADGLAVMVADENGVAVPAALVTLEDPAGGRRSRGVTDRAGRCALEGLAPGSYRARVEKEGFYVLEIPSVVVGAARTLEVQLSHEQELAESLDVPYSPPAIDPTETAASSKITSQDIVNVPYPTTRDYRNVLPFIPGVVQDETGQVHVHGSAAYQTYDLLDGFNVNDPATGLLELRVSVDALRTVDVQSSRYSVQYGKGTGGVLNLETGSGDDRFRLSGTNFLPSFQTVKGVAFDNWTPRATVSGPIVRGKAWFFDAASAEYNLNLIEELPDGADRSSSWRWNNLSKVLFNLSQTNILTASYLYNRYRAPHAGLSRFAPIETSQDQTNKAFLATVKDQAYFSNGTALEVGFAASRFLDDLLPYAPPAEGDPYVVSPQGRSGNFYRTERTAARRFQGIANVYFPRRAGHEIAAGVDFDRITYDRDLELRPITIVGTYGTRVREILFSDGAPFERDNFEASAFAQDRWTLTDRLLLESGVRVDWDEIVRRAVLSPRVATSYLLTRGGHTKLTAGVGLYHDATNLEIVTRPSTGQRLDLFYAMDGQTVVATRATAFAVDERSLEVPRSLNWSVGVERALPAGIDLVVEFLQKRGADGFAYVREEPSADVGDGGLLVLRNVRRDRYTALQVTARHAFKSTYSVLASYTRSSARSNAVIDFTIDNPLFSQQAGGPLPWDAPNRFLSWGSMPLVKRFDLSYSVDWRTGYPFSVVDEEQQLVGEPNSRRFPAYFSLNVHLERRVRLFGFQWALRAGVNNLTNRDNPTAVNNNVDSPEFLTYGGAHHRVFSARIRFLGRK